MNRSVCWILLLAPMVAGCRGDTASRPGPAPWTLERIEDGGFGDPGNLGAASLAVIAGRLHVGTWNTSSGGKVYASVDARKWSPLNAGGFGRRSNFCVLSLVEFGEWIYAGTWNVEEGAGLFRVRRGVRVRARWEPVTENGFGDPGNLAITSLCRFDGHLYAGCYNHATGSEVWRSRSGDPATWRQVNADGFGDPRNSDATRFLVDRGHLYVTTESLRRPKRGCQIWRTNGALDPPFDQWECIVGDGFSDARNVNIWAFSRFGDHLYAATWNPENGVEVWRTPSTSTALGPGAAWECVARGGFGDRRYYMSTAFAAVSDTLFLAVVGRHRYEGNPFRGGVKVHEARGGLLMMSRDGRRWDRVDRAGFLRFPMLGAASLAVFRGRLYVGCVALDRPLEVWTLNRG